MGGQARQGRQQGQVVREGLAEADAGIQPDPVPPHPGGQGRVRPGQQEGFHLRDHVPVAGIGLHGPGLALHVHEDHRAAQRRRRLGTGVSAQGGHVVPDGGPGGDGGAGHGGLHGVHGQGAVGPPRQTLDHRQHPVQFLLFGDGVCPRTGRLPADVQDIRPLRRQPQPRGDGGLRRVVAAAVGEAVRRHIDHAHHQRAPPRRIRQQVLKPHDDTLRPR